MQDSTKEEAYIKETAETRDYFQDVILKANFVGNKQITRNKVDLMFKQTKALDADLSQIYDDELLLKFAQDINKEEYYKQRNDQKYFN